MIGPDPKMICPIKGNRNMQFIKNTISRPNIIVGDMMLKRENRL